VTTPVRNQSLTRQDRDPSASTSNHPSDSRLEPSAPEFVPRLTKRDSKARLLFYR